MLFAELTYTLATEEAERIGVDHVARMTATGTGENSTGIINYAVHQYKHLYYFMLKHLCPQKFFFLFGLSKGLSEHVEMHIIMIIVSILIVLVLPCTVVAEHLIAQHSAIKMLHSRVKIILEYVKAVEAGENKQF